MEGGKVTRKAEPTVINAFIKGILPYKRLQRESPFAVLFGLYAGK
jgi:hypothetical protein